MKPCFICGKEIWRKPYEFSGNPICGPECMKIHRSNMNTKEKITKPCIICGKLVSKWPCFKEENFTCSPECGKENVKRVNGAVCRERNKTLMTPEVKEKLRNFRLGKGEGKTYTKTYGRHTHRIVAEQKLGRALLPGEIVHHKDENKRNNDPDNIHVFANQAEHAKFHMDLRLGRKTKNDI